MSLGMTGSILCKHVIITKKYKNRQHFSALNRKQSAITERYHADVIVIYINN
jgi:hypothetical protein